MRVIKLIIINLFFLFALISVIVFGIVVFSEIVRFTKKNFLYKNDECIRSSCHKVYENNYWAKKHFHEYSQIKFHYESPVVWRADKFDGETINIDGIYNTRKTVSKKIDQDVPNKIVYFFGGSVMWGFGSNDENTIPSHFQELSGYKSFNFGESAWTSDQSLIYLIKLIKDGHKPDYVVFLNGINDVEKCNNISANEHAFLTEDKLKLKFRENIRKYPKTTFENFFSIPIEIIQRVKTKFINTNPKKYKKKISKCFSSDLSYKIANNLVSNWKIAKFLVERNGGKFLAFLEPHISFTTTKIDERITFDKDGITSLLFNSVYPKIIELSEESDYIYDFKSIYNELNDYIFIDHGHVSPKGNEFMSKQILIKIKSYE